MVDARYYSHTREDLIRLVPQDAGRVLEIGCGAGMTGKALKDRGIEEVVGVELEPEPGRKAMQYYDRVILGDVEKITLPYNEGYFDCIIYGDVLEHLVDPWRLLREHNRFLRTGGIIICSIPNVRYFKVTRSLVLQGSWEYEDDGVLDRTHLRFFTKGSMERMLRDAGFVIVRVVRRPSCASWLKWLNAILGNLLMDHLVRKYIVIATKGKNQTE